MYICKCLILFLGLTLKHDCIKLNLNVYSQSKNWFTARNVIIFLSSVLSA